MVCACVAAQTSAVPANPRAPLPPTPAPRLWLGRGRRRPPYLESNRGTEHVFDAVFNLWTFRSSWDLASADTQMVLVVSCCTRCPFQHQDVRGAWPDPSCTARGCTPQPGPHTSWDRPGPALPLTLLPSADRSRGLLQVPTYLREG